MADACIVGSALVRALASRPGARGVTAAADLARRLADGLNHPLRTAA
ncbi:hypothetical protein ACFV9W_03400 [Streptomyces sp. NPDC059897]